MAGHHLRRRRVKQVPLHLIGIATGFGAPMSRAIVPRGPLKPVADEHAVIHMILDLLGATITYLSFSCSLVRPAVRPD